jgi:hypothetical protein
MDPEISRMLFDDQLKEVRNSELPSILGWEFLKAEYPEIVVRLRHRHGTARNFLLEFSRYNQLPPSISLVDDDYKPILDITKLPTEGQHFFRYNVEHSPRPSICYEFAAEYYEWWHPGSEAVWHSYRANKDFQILGIIQKLYDLYNKTNG